VQNVHGLGVTETCYTGKPLKFQCERVLPTILLSLLAVPNRQAFRWSSNLS